MRLGCGEGIRTLDLRVMSPTSCRCSTPQAKYEPDRPIPSNARPRIRAYAVPAPPASRRGVRARRGVRSGRGRGANSDTPISRPAASCALLSAGVLPRYSEGPLRAEAPRANRERLPMSADDLYPAALAVRERAYAPYSGYLVGAALRDERGAVHVGRERRERRLPAEPVRRGLGDRGPGGGRRPQDRRGLRGRRRAERAPHPLRRVPPAPAGVRRARRRPSTSPASAG